MTIVLIVLIVSLGVGVIGTLRLVRWSPRRPELANEDDSQIVDEPLISPLSAQRCVMFESYANLYEPTESDAEPRTLVAQLAKRGMQPFELETSIGVILVDATEADLELVPTPVFPRRPEREALFLREHDRDERTIESTVFEEISVDPGSLVSVRGKAVVESPTKIRLIADRDQPLVIGTPRKSPIQT